MFTSFAAIVLVLALPALASAVSVRRQNNECNTGTLQCCNQVQSADSSEAASIAALFGGVIGGPDTLVGFSCSPITVIGVGSGSSCAAQPVCCTDNHFDGLVAAGCQPFNI